MNDCKHSNLELISGGKEKVRCKHCHLTISVDELAGGCCPECFESTGRRRYDFEPVEDTDSGTTRYRCEDCGAVIENRPIGHPGSASESKFWIVKTGATFAEIRRAHGDFQDWTRAGLGLSETAVCVVRAADGEPLPAPERCAGVVVTGSHAMVTDAPDWSEHLARWIVRVVERHIPFLGICYGHQLLAHAFGGQVGDHPEGMEIGTVDIQLLPEGRKDRLFSVLPDTFAGHTIHTQSVLRLPAGAVVLAQNAYEPHHGFRIGPCAWGVQFHPEYNRDIMRAYVSAQRDALLAQGRDPEAVSGAVCPTPRAAALLEHFTQIATEAGASRGAAADRKGG